MDRTSSIKTFHVTTYGCQMNLADSSTLVSTLTTRGYRRVSSEEEADLFVLNTCSVRQKAEQRVIGRLWDLKKHKLHRPHVRIAVVGCMAQRMGASLKTEVPHVDFVLGTDRMFELPDVLEGREDTTAVMTAFGHENIDMIAPVKEQPFSAFVTISRGCDNYCTYCIVPYVRGDERAHSAEQIVDSVKRLVDEGVVEVMLLGQNVNSYRWEDVDFPGLLDRVARLTEIKRIRFMTSHPKDLSSHLIDTMAAHPKVMPHIHLPLQSGSDRVLKMMGRGYSAQYYLSIVDEIRRKLDYVSLTTDLIVGFPTESDAEYRQTLGVVEQVQFDAAFMFRYSVRPGTEAAKLDDDIPEQTKIERLSELIELQKSIGYQRNQRETDQIRLGLVEGYSRRSQELYRARTEGNKIVLFPGTDIQAGAILPIKVNTADAFTLHGEIANVA